MPGEVAVKLHWSPRSPFVRKIMIVLHETGLLDRVDCVRTMVSMSAAPNADLLPDNPLGKIPTLVLDDGRALFDSRVIAEYLDGLHAGPKLFPDDRDRRIGHLRWMAFADGLTDVLLLWRHERIRAEGTQSPTILAAFETKVRHAVAAFDREAADLAAEPFGIGHISLVCALGQMDFRYGASNWRKAHPRLAAWHAEAAKRPSVAATEVKDDGTGPQDPPWAVGPALVFA
jgi:glutathione S-transferase